MNEYQTYWLSLSDEERNILTQYYDFSDEVNNYLRTDASNNSTIENRIRIMKGAIERYSCPNYIVLYRGTYLCELKGKTIGEEFTIDSFVSAADQVDTAVNYLHYDSNEQCLLLEIECPMYTKMALIDFGDTELERILPPKLVYEIITVSCKHGESNIASYLTSIGALAINSFNFAVLPKLKELHIGRIRIKGSASSFV